MKVLPDKLREGYYLAALQRKIDLCILVLFIYFFLHHCRQLVSQSVFNDNRDGHTNFLLYSVVQIYDFLHILDIEFHLERVIWKSLNDQRSTPI